MDVRFGEAMEIHKTWHWWERLLLKKYFLSVNSLNELFSLRHEADTWSEQLLAQFISKETDKIRDMYMSKLYDGVTVNLAHIVAMTIVEVMKQGTLSLPKDVFHKMIYISFKKLQADPKVHLHSSFFRPRYYKNLHRGISLLLKRNLRTNKLAGLIKEDDQNYYFHEKILQKGEYNIIRMENPIMVRVNEIGPVAQVKNIIVDTIKKMDDTSERDIASFMFDDEIRSVAFNKELYSKSRFEEINSKETITQSTDPYLLPQKKTAKKGILLIHGFLSSPPELSELGIKLHKEGHAVLGMRVSGHGTSPWDLNSRTCENWIGSVRRNYTILSAFCDEIYIVGFSGGGALALQHASTNPEKLAGVASVCTPLILKDKMMHLVPFLHTINKIFSFMPKVESLVPFKANKSSYPDTNYATMPVAALNELRYLVQQVKKTLKYVTCPVSILQGIDDPVVNPKAAHLIYKALSSHQKIVHMINTDRHGIIYDNVGETHKLLIDFVKDAKKSTINKDAS
jgi:esterase/lipase